MSVSRLSGEELEQTVRESSSLEGVHVEHLGAAGACLESVVCVNCRFDSGSLNGANLARSQFRSCELSNLDFRSACWKGASLSYLRIKHSDMTDASLETARLRGCRLENVRLETAHLEQSIWSDCEVLSCEFPAATFRRCLMIATRLAGTGSSSVSLCDADLTGACLLDVDLRHADLCGARLDRALLCRVDLRGADLTGTSFDGAVLADVRFNPGELEPERSVGQSDVGAREAVAPGWASVPPEDGIRRFLRSAPRDLVVCLALELCHQVGLQRKAPEVIDFEPSGDGDAPVSHPDDLLISARRAYRDGVSDEKMTDDCLHVSAAAPGSGRGGGTAAFASPSVYLVADQR